MKLSPVNLGPVRTLYEDEFILVVDKPAGWAVFAEAGGVTQTVTDFLTKKYGAPLFPVHRLDNTTSGILVIAKDQASHDFLREIWNSGKVVKEYTALVLGTIKDKLIIETPIAHHPSRKNRMVPCESAEIEKELSGRPAYTEVKRLSIHTDKKKSFSSLVSVTIRTGLRHQIRVHLASVGFPLVGDKLYQNERKRREDHFKFTRPFLHASRIEFPHPHNKRLIQLDCELAEDLKNLLLHSASSSATRAL